MIYNDYSDACRLEQFDINNVTFIAKLVIDVYVFNGAHKPNDVKKYVICSAAALNGNAMTTLGMREIMNIIKEKIKEEIKTNSNDIIELVDEVYADNPEKAMRIKEILMMSDDTMNGVYEFWRKLKEEGVKYFVVEYPILNILCFHEEIEEY